MNIRTFHKTLVVSATFSLVFPAICLAQTAPQTAVRTSQLDQQWLETVVSIEHVQEPNKELPIGTGFVVASSRKHLILMTAKHVVIDSNGKLRNDLVYRVNHAGGGTQLLRDTELAKNGGSTWFISDQHDLAVRFLPIVKGVAVKAIPLDRFMQESQVEAGTPLAALGFPMGLRSVNHAMPIARRGMVGRADPAMILADLFVFPGNSGGPVLYVPAFKTGGVFFGDHRLVGQEMLVGVVSSFIPYQDVAISAQTNRPRVVFEENSGLANLVPAWTAKTFITTGAVLEFDEKLDGVQ